MSRNLSRSRALKPRILWVSESPRFRTGHGRVAREITRRLAQSGRYEVGVLGWAMEPSLEDPGGCVLFSPGPQPWSVARANRIIEDFGPEIVITSGPLPALRIMREVPLREYVSWVGYVFFEGAPVPPEARTILRTMDRAVVASAWCEGALRDCPRHEKRLGPCPRRIPLGVDTQVFYPRSDRKALRKGLGLEGKFIIGCVARNDFRKQIPILVKAFAAFARRRPEALLYLHTDPDGPVWRLLELVKRLGVEKRVAFSRGLAGPMGVGGQSLNALYNLFDVMALPTMGEAFGLPILEAMAAGVAVVATDCSAVRELLEGRGELIAVREWLTMGWDNADYAVADVDDLVSKLELLHGDSDRRSEYAKRGRAFAETMTWDHTAKAWMRLLDNLLMHGSRGIRQDLTPWLEALRDGTNGQPAVENSSECDTH